MDLNKIANEGYHKIAQIEGTEDLLRDYFSEISNPNDTLYVFLCPLMFAPRMDGIMQIVQEMLYCKNPNKYKWKKTFYFGKNTEYRKTR